LPNLDAVIALLQAHGLLILAPFAIIEGPIATVIAAYLAHQGVLNVMGVFWICVLGDLIGDGLLYALGRFGAGRLPISLARRLGVTDARRLTLSQHFATKGGRTLLLAKITHSAGMPVLIASGMAHMRFDTYLWFNLMGTLPKTGVLMLLGYFFGAAYGLIDTYIYRGSLLVLIVMALAAGAYLIWRRI
jgi:membrane protein DedA with SNARE-associated domain